MGVLEITEKYADAQWCIEYGGINVIHLYTLFHCAGEFIHFLEMP